MKLFKKRSEQRPAGLTRDESLVCVPVVNEQIQSVILDSGDIQLEYPVRMQPLFASVFQRFNPSSEVPTKKLQLDKMGSAVYQMIDGQVAVKEIIENFAKNFGITIHEAESSVTLFLVQLGKRGIIALR